MKKKKGLIPANATARLTLDLQDSNAAHSKRTRIAAHTISSPASLVAETPVFLQVFFFASKGHHHEPEGEDLTVFGSVAHLSGSVSRDATHAAGKATEGTANVALALRPEFDIAESVPAASVGSVPVG